MIASASSSPLSDALPRTLARLPGISRLPWPGPLALVDDDGCGSSSQPLPQGLQRGRK